MTAPLAITTRPMRGDDRAYVAHSWAEAYKHAPKMHALSWKIYKRLVVPDLDAVLARPETEVLIATAHGGSDAIVGWIAFERGRRVSTVHWIHTRFRLTPGAAGLRRRRIATDLLAAADLGARLVYTFHAPRSRADAPSETELVQALARRGVSAAFVPYEEWKA